MVTELAVGDRPPSPLCFLSLARSLGGTGLASLESLSSGPSPTSVLSPPCVPRSAWRCLPADGCPLSVSLPEGASSRLSEEPRVRGRPHCSASPWLRATPSPSCAWMPQTSCYSQGPKVGGTHSSQVGSGRPAHPLPSPEGYEEEGRTRPGPEDVASVTHDLVSCPRPCLPSQPTLLAPSSTSSQNSLRNSRQHLR